MIAPLPPELSESSTAQLPVPDGPNFSRSRDPRASVDRIRHLGRRVRRVGIDRTRSVLRRVLGIDAQLTELTTRLQVAVDQAERLQTRLGPITASIELEKRTVATNVEANRVNLELLKSEFRTLLATVQELGMAFAPATGLAGAGARFAELREAVNGLERRLRNVDAHLEQLHRGTASVAPGQVVVSAETAPRSDTADAGVTPRSTLFNYVGFERRFRGDPEDILRNLEERYATLLLEHQPIVDIGCGRGELLERLAAKGADVIGVEPDPGMVAEGRARGLTIHQSFVGDYLRSVPDHSLGSIISTHVAEHLDLDDLIEMIELSSRKLEPGGVFVAETPNPASLIVLGNSYILDPTHVWPLHPALFAFLCETAGFRDVRLNFYSPAQAYHLPAVAVPEPNPALAGVIEQVNAAFGRLNEVLFGSQEYAVIATTAPLAAALESAPSDD
ncbi:MAG: methyltransferase domain-containing protein [Actinobacteria bacterium]|nr:methyltransferase domain-containing protein [Actinomycetota bacterium]